LIPSPGRRGELGFATVEDWQDLPLLLPREGGGDEFVDKNLLSYFILSAMVEKKSSIV
jgi:hypothetical protein